MIKLDKNSLDLMTDLLDDVHDRYFRFEDIVFNKESGEWKLYLGEKKKWLVGKVVISKVLKIASVTHWSCTDTAGIGQNSINEVHIDFEKRTIDIECNAPGEIKLQVTPSCEISVEQKE